jgi:hypothetical protein
MRARGGAAAFTEIRGGGSGSTAGAVSRAAFVAMSKDGALPDPIPKMSAAVFGDPTRALGGALTDIRPAFTALSEKRTELSLRAPVGFSP